MHGKPRKRWKAIERIVLRMKVRKTRRNGD
jgi:hypothetical protein